MIDERLRERRARMMEGTAGGEFEVRERKKERVKERERERERERKKKKVA